MENLIVQKAIESFLKLFSARLEIKDIVHECIYYGVCFWVGEDETQDIKWINIYNSNSLMILSEICNYISDNNLNKGDRILISEKELKVRLSKDNWNDLEMDLALEILFSFTVMMYDDGEYASSFMVHF